MTGVHPHGMMDTIIVFSGVDASTGERVTFAADHRPARLIMDAIEAGEVPIAEVPEYLILGG